MNNHHRLLTLLVVMAITLSASMGSLAIAWHHPLFHRRLPASTEINKTMPISKQSVTSFSNGNAMNVAFLAEYPEPSLGGEVIHEYSDSTGARYWVTAETGDISYYNDNQHHQRETSPVITQRDAEDIAETFAMKHVRNFEALTRWATYRALEDTKHNVYVMDWMYKKPLNNLQTQYFKDKGKTPRPFHTTVATDYSGEVVLLQNEFVGP